MRMARCPLLSFPSTEIEIVIVMFFIADSLFPNAPTMCRRGPPPAHPAAHGGTGAKLKEKVNFRLPFLPYR
jgi:hypothetical protein